MHSTGILRFDDSVNDMTFWSKLKYTNKGPNSIGNKNGNNIGIKYRDLHPSMLSEIDILVCGNSDPGTSGSLSPFAKIDGLYFDPSPEPNDFYFNLIKDIEKKYKKEGKIFIRCEFDDPNEYYNALYSMNKFSEDNIKIYGTSRENQYELIVNESNDMDDPNAHTTVALQKKRKKRLTNLEPEEEESNVEEVKEEKPKRGRKKKSES